MFKEVIKKEKKDKITNQFHFIERATQTKNNDTTETSAQTDPPPMYVQFRHIQTWFNIDYKFIYNYRKHFSDTVSPYLILEAFRLFEKEKEDQQKLK